MESWQSGNAPVLKTEVADRCVGSIPTLSAKNKMKGYEMAKYINDIVNWMLNYSESSGTDGYIIGLSGGVDSAVVAALAVKIVGSNGVHGLIMPIESNVDDQEDAIKIADHLRISYDIIDMSKAYNEMVNVYPHGRPPLCETTVTGENNLRLMKANIKARLRMTMLYQFAGNFNYLVAGTGNRSEDAVGYFTKYGDGGVDILPIAEFYKGEIREMAIELGLPKEIANRTSTAGLWEGQTDEEDLGISYDDLDIILKFLDNRDEHVPHPRLMEKLPFVLNLIHKNKHKSEYPPIFKR